MHFPSLKVHQVWHSCMPHILKKNGPDDWRWSVFSHSFSRLSVLLLLSTKMVEQDQRKFYILEQRREKRWQFWESKGKGWLGQCVLYHEKAIGEPCCKCLYPSRNKKGDCYDREKPTSIWGEGEKWKSQQAQYHCKLLSPPQSEVLRKQDTTAQTASKIPAPRNMVQLAILGAAIYFS